MPPVVPPRLDPAAPLPPWPGCLEVHGEHLLHVRRTPALDPQAPLEPALAVHGLGGSARNWTDVSALLRHRLEFAAVDLPGFGESPPPQNGDLSVAGHVRAVLAVLTAEAERAGQPVHLLGSSLGGVVATEVAAARPDLVRTLTLISPALPHYRVQPAAVRLPVLAAPLLGSIVARRLARLDAETRTRATITLCFADPDRVPPQRLREAVAETARRDTLPYGAQAVRASLRGLLATYLNPVAARAAWRAAGSVSAPTLLVYGRRDQLVDPDSSLRAARTFANSWLVTLPGVGHLAQMEAPELVADLVGQLVGNVAVGERR